MKIFDFTGFKNRDLIDCRPVGSEYAPIYNIHKHLRPIGTSDLVWVRLVVNVKSRFLKSSHEDFWAKGEVEHF